jgi:hypothetical protein
VNTCGRVLGVVARGGNFLGSIKSVALWLIASLWCGDGKKPGVEVPKWSKKGSKIVAGPPPPGEFSATEASCGKTPGLDQYWHPGEWQTSSTNY